MAILGNILLRENESIGVEYFNPFNCMQNKIVGITW